MIFHVLLCEGPKAVNFPSVTPKKKKPKKPTQPYAPYLVELFKVVFNRNATLYGSHRLMKFLPGVPSVIIRQFGSFCERRQGRLETGRPNGTSAPLPPVWHTEKVTNTPPNPPPPKPREGGATRPSLAAFDPGTPHPANYF